MARAEKSIDVQYFLMKPDTAGIAFAAGLVEAADRGVRVRFLLDDIFTTVEDPALMILDHHKNIEIRLYNPIARSGIRALNFLGDFRRANRRMHNKSFTVDNQVTVVGGRNIADEYFGIKADGEFLDFDVVGLGPVAARVSGAFDLFWNDARSIPLAGVSHDYSDAALDETRTKVSAAQRASARATVEHANRAALVQGLFDGEVELFSAVSSVITDDPAKLANPAGDRDFMLMAAELRKAVDAAKSEIIVLTPYFVPREEGVRFWESVASRGVRVVIVTNSLAANNHTAVHSAYGKYRKKMIDAGVELYEVNGFSPQSPDMRVTMHTKAFTIDRERAFVGSLNVDPRSLDFNSEMGLIIESPPLASLMADAVFAALETRAWRVDRDKRGRLQWTTTINDSETIATSEPGVNAWRKVKAWFLKLVPERQL